MRLSISPNSTPPTSADVNRVVTALRAELEACADPDQRALLHYDLALVHEQARDDHSAAKELLAAVNASAALREPLEHLIALIERRRSHVNLGKLLDRLARVSDVADEITRAELARGDFLADYRSDLPAATLAYGHVLKLHQGHSLAWLSLHYLGTRQSDAALVEDALLGRISAAQDAAYQNALRLQLARFQAMAGQHERAWANLQAATEATSPLRFAALRELEQLLPYPSEYEERAQILKQQAAVIDAAMQDSEQADVFGVPAFLRSSTVAADTWWRAALNTEAHAADSEEVGVLLTHARGMADRPFTFLRALIRHLERRHQHESLHGLLSEALAHAHVPEPIVAGWWSRTAAEHHRQGRHDDASRSLDRALHHDPHAVTAIALQLNILWGCKRYAELGRAYEAMAEQSDSDEAHFRTHVLAAVAWALSGDTTTPPRATLSLAAAGGSQTSLARIGKFLASWRKDGSWLNDALLIIKDGAPVTERVNAALELARRACLRNETTEAEQHLVKLTDTTEAGLLSSVILAYSSSFESSRSDRLPSLRRVAAAAGGEGGLALQQLVVGLMARRGQTSRALDELRLLHQHHRDHVLVATQLAHLLLGMQQPESAAQVLVKTAQTAMQPTLRQALYLHAGLIEWRAEQHELALQRFQAASDAGSVAAAHLVHWALRAAQPDDPAARRKALDLSWAPANAVDSNAYALERFALEVGFSSQHNAAAEALNDADELPLDDVGAAIQLARALYPDAAHHGEALKALENHSAIGKELVAATEYYRVRSQATPPSDTLLALAKEWARRGSLEAALEWFSLTVTTGDRDAEAEARLAIASHLHGDGRAAVLASVILLRQLVGAKGNVESPAHRAVELANAEVCLPTALPAERATTLGALADHYDGDAAMADKLTIVTLAAYNKLACAEHEQALQLFRRVVEADADDVCSWYGIADCCRALELAREEAIALERLSALLLDPREAAAASKRAASLYLDVLAEDELGLRFLARAVELDIEDFETFDRWFRHVRKQGDSERVIDLCTARLAVADDPKELTRLHWERARAFRRLGGLEEALTDLDNVRLLDPQHVGARALGSEIFIHLRNYAQAADELAQLAAMPHAPPEQRHMSALAAVDLYDSHLADVDAVLNVLHSMANAPGDGMAVKERVAKSVARAGRWEEAVALLGELAVERKTSAGRAEAARLRLAILRDEMRSPDQLTETVQVLLCNSPADAEALDLVLDGALDETTSAALLFEHLPHLLREAAERLQPESAARLARAAEHLNRSDVRLLALASLSCLGAASDGALAELRSLQQLCPSHPLTALDGASLEALVDPDDSGPLLQIMRELAPHLPEVIGPTLHSLGFGRRERKRALDRADVRAEVAAWKRALLLEHEPELFIGGAEPERIDVFAEGKHGSLVLGLDVRAPLEPAQRGALASAVFSLRHGTSVALSRGPVEVAALLASAVRITGASVPGPAFALAPEFERLLSRELPRRVRRAIEPLAAQASAQQQDPLHYAHAALATLDRVAAIAAGEFFVVPTPLEEEALQRQRRLLAFCLSPTYLAIRRQLGMNPQ